jgi:membrane protease YdiL (CAAX protease family)
MICIDCSTELPHNTRFCSYCGSSQVVINENEEKRNSVLSILGLFYGIDMVLCLLIKSIDGLHQLRYYILFDILTAIITIVFIIFTFKDIKNSLKWNNFSIGRLLLYIVIAILFSIVVQFVVGLLNRNLFEEDYYYYFTFSNTSSPMLYMLLMIAVQPAIVEELGYRGLIMSQLSTILDSKQVIFISAFVFALIHLNIFSMLWIMPFAIFLGYIKEKENTIWYGVVVHFMFNATACLFEFYDLRLF